MISKLLKLISLLCLTLPLYSPQPHSSRNRQTIGAGRMPLIKRRSTSPKEHQKKPASNKLSQEISGLVKTIKTFEDYDFELYEDEIAELALLHAKARAKAAEYIKPSSMSLAKYLKRITEQQTLKETIEELKTSIEEDVEFSKRLGLFDNEIRDLKRKRAFLIDLEKAHNEQHQIKITPELYAALTVIAEHA